MTVTGIVFSSVSRLNDSDSTFVWASMLVLRAGCGAPTLISGPKYAVVHARYGSWLEVEHVADLLGERVDVLEVGALLRRDLSVGSGASNSTVGMMRGTTPNMAYLARITATRASIGIAGNGVPLKSMRPITAVRSTPVTDSMSCEGSLPGVTSCFVITPSMSTCGVPSMVATMSVAQDRRQRAAGREEDRVQRRSLAEHELQPEAARLAALGRVGDLDVTRDRPVPHAAAAPARPGRPSA